MEKENDIMGWAISQYWKGDVDAEINVSFGEDFTDVLPVKYFFREYVDFPEIEKKALDLCYGKILDVGAGAGCHTLYLEKENESVVALDISGYASEVMIERGVKKVVCKDIFEYKETDFDTILLLMNTAGLSGTISGLKSLMSHLKTLLNDDGQIILDFTDVIYYYEEDEGVFEMNLTDNYYGEFNCKLKYKDLIGSEFKWLYCNYETLSDVCEDIGMKTELLMEQDDGAYLVSVRKY